jgi:hypothetical protein
LPGSRVLFWWSVALSASLADKRCGHLRTWHVFLGYAKIYKDRMISVRHNDVGGFHIAVQDWRHACMQVLERVANWQDPLNHLTYWKWVPTKACQFLLQVLTFDEVHYQIESLLPLEVFADFGDIVVVKRLKPLALKLKLLARPARLIHQLFERDDIVLAKEHVHDLIYCAKAAAPNDRANLIARMDECPYR